MFDASAYVTLNMPTDIYRYLCAHLWILQSGEKLAAFLGPVLYRAGNSAFLLFNILPRGSSVRIKFVIILAINNFGDSYGIKLCAVFFYW